MIQQHKPDSSWSLFPSVPSQSHAAALAVVQPEPDSFEFAAAPAVVQPEPDSFKFAAAPALSVAAALAFVQPEPDSLLVVPALVAAVARSQPFTRAVFFENPNLRFGSRAARASSIFCLNSCTCGMDKQLTYSCVKNSKQLCVDGSSDTCVHSRTKKRIRT